MAVPNNFRLCSHCDRPVIDSKLQLRLAGLLPESYEHHICKVEIVGKEVNVTLRLSVSTKEGAKQWLESMQKSSLMTFRVERSYNCSGVKVAYKTDFRCQHNTKPRTATSDCHRGSKNTNCPAGLSIVVKVSTFEKSDGIKRKCRSGDPHMPDHPMVVKLKCTHNHPIRAADALKHRDVSEEVKQKFLDLFSKGYTPSKALELHKYDLQLEHGDNYIFVCADRAITPDLQYCYRLYYQAFKKEYVKATGEFVMKELEKKIEEGTLGENRIKLALVGPEKKQAALAIVTPLMQRVHKLIKHSGELVFIYASGNMDRQGCRVFLLLTHSCAGGLPLGVLITTSESTETVTEALALYNSLLDNSAFFGRGPKLGPELFMTDDSTSERQALSAIYPEATLLLCVCHLLQAFWRFLWEFKNGVRKEDRPHLFSLLKDMVYCSSVDELQAKFEAMENDETLAKYEKVQKHLEDVYARKSSWAVCYCDDLNVRNNNTNNYAEASMWIMKDQILERTKAYNVIQLVDFIVTRLEAYYERRIIDVCNNRLDRVLQSRFLPSVAAGCKINPDEIEQVDEDLYMVPSETDETVGYVVHLGQGVCSCKIGMTGGPCKHQYLVIKTYNAQSCWNFIPVNDPAMRMLLYKVATGCANVPDDWFVSLNHQQKPTEPEKVTQPIMPMETSSGNPNDQEIDHDNPPVEDCEENPPGEDDTRSSTSNTSNSGGDSCENDPILNGLNEAFHAIQRRYMQDKDSLGESVKTFTKQVQKLASGTDTALASALHCFGRYSGAANALGKRTRKHLLSTKTIGVQHPEGR
ncbi:uncharacterized protein LOC143030765 [Oratosquilla oratoria]|uniref:uncharacterized protein LOC143030765 n=1 Tax=Oratosquilla oratoria TaxID=337810 RepID=UPI003F75CF3B